MKIAGAPGAKVPYHEPINHMTAAFDALFVDAHQYSSCIALQYIVMCHVMYCLLTPVLFPPFIRAPPPIISKMMWLQAVTHGYTSRFYRVKISFPFFPFLAFFPTILPPFFPFGQRLRGFQIPERTTHAENKHRTCTILYYRIIEYTVASNIQYGSQDGQLIPKRNDRLS